MSALLNDDGYMCCLGFAAVQITGLTEDQIRGYGQYEELDSELHEYLLENGTPFCEPFETEHDYDPVPADTKFHNEAVTINDFKIGDEQTLGVFVEDEADREQQLINLFKLEGIDVKFV